MEDDFIVVDSVDGDGKITERPKRFSSSKQKKKKIKTDEDPRVDEVYSILKTYAEKNKVKDKATTYGEHVANKLRSYTDFIRLNTEHKINCILHESDMLMLQQNNQTDYPIHFPGPSSSNNSFIPLHSIVTSSGNTHTLSSLNSAPSFTPNNNFSPLPSSSVPFTPIHESNSLNTQENASPYYNIN